MLRLIKSWFVKDDGIAALEAAMVFPLLLTMLMGAVDLGSGILAAQKVITASQVAADLIGRNETVSNTEIDEAIEAAGLAMDPYSSSAVIGIDLVSIEFAADDNVDILWRRTQNMSPNEGAVNSTAGLGVEGEGVVAVTVQVPFEPLFVGFLFESMEFTEVAFVRGRKSATIPFE